MSRSLRLSAAVALAGLCAAATVLAQDIPRAREFYQPAEIKIGLERTICFGACPIYRLEIAGDGAVSYTGIKFVGVEGAQKAQITPVDVESLVNDFLRLHFFDLPDKFDGGETVKLKNGLFYSYRESITDIPSAILSLQLGERRKQIVLRYRVPVELKQLADRIDEVTGTKRWVGRR